MVLNFAFKAIEQICKIAYDQGIIIVAATLPGQKTWPACFETVIAVAAEEEASQDNGTQDAGGYWNLLVPGVDWSTGTSGSSVAAAFATNNLLRELRQRGRQ